MDSSSGIATQEKEVIKSKRGSVSGTRQTKHAFEKNNVIQSEKEAPLSQGKIKYEVCGNLLRNGVSYKTGDILEEVKSKAVIELIKLGRLKKL